MLCLRPVRPGWLGEVPLHTSDYEAWPYPVLSKPLLKEMLSPSVPSRGSGVGGAAQAREVQCALLHQHVSAPKDKAGV